MWELFESSRRSRACHVRQCGRGYQLHLYVVLYRIQRSGTSAHRAARNHSPTRGDEDGAMRYRAGLHDCRGQALVEFALCIVLLLAVIFAVIEFGRLMLVYTTIGNAARIGARYAIVHAGDSTGTQTAVNGFLHAGTVNTSNSTVTVSLPGYPDGTVAGC